MRVDAARRASKSGSYSGRRAHGLAEERIVPGSVVLGRQPERGRVRSGPVQPVGGDLALVAGERDELRHPRAHPAALVGLVHVAGRGQCPLAIGEHRDEWRFVRDERPHLLRVLGHEGQRVHRAAAAGEQVHRPGIDRRDEPMQVVRVLLDRVLRRAVGARAPLRPARVVGHDRAIGEVLRERAEPGGAHR